MKRLALLLIILCLTGLTLAISYTPGQQTISTPGPAARSVVPPNTSIRADEAKVIRIIDGDSMIVELNGHPAELRLMGIDAPEYGQEWGEEAELFAYDWTKGQLLTLTYGTRRTDRYDRLLAYVWNGERMLNEELVNNGLALPYMLKKKEPHYERINAALREAKQDKAGFWKQGGLEMEPRIWRRKHR